MLLMDKIGLSNTDQEFAEKIIYLLENDKYRKVIGKRGSSFVRKNFTWEIAEKAFKKIL